MVHIHMHKGVVCDLIPQHEQHIFPSSFTHVRVRCAIAVLSRSTVPFCVLPTRLAVSLPRARTFFLARCR